jgi:hypothetical protein
MIDAKPLWAALYRCLNLVFADAYEYRKLSIRHNSARCDDLTMSGK